MRRAEDVGDGGIVGDRGSGKSARGRTLGKASREMSEVEGGRRILPLAGPDAAVSLIPHQVSGVACIIIPLPCVRFDAGHDVRLRVQLPAE